ncbi:MAG: hypothetical protein R2771_03455 [Saprospiraceae bacterium]
MKNIFLISVFLLYLLSNIEAQNSSRNSVSIEIIPLAVMQANATGLNVSYQHDKNRFVHFLSIGFIYTNFHPGTQLGSVKVSDTLPARYSTEVDITTNRPYPLGGVVDENDFNNLDNYGIKQFIPKMSFRLNRFVNYDLLYKVIDRKLKVNFGLGVGIGLTNREDSYVGFVGTIKNEFNELSDELWVNINIRAKYIYLNASARLNIEYPISKNVNLGISGGIQKIFDKNFRR